VLKDICRMLIARIEEYLTENGNLNDAATLQIFKTEISNYLLPRGTAAAHKLYVEYETVGWEYPAIKNI
jgi:hypothetical protein